MIQQEGTEWVCSICKKKFGRVENAIVHDFTDHSGDKNEYNNKGIK
jgi:hypothetical protein